MQFIEPDWPAPNNVRAAVTLRADGVSTGSFESLNLATHVGDRPEAVTENRRRVRTALQLPHEPAWLDQVHGSTVIEARSYENPPVADASITKKAEQVCAVLTADCLPVIFCDRDGTCVAAAHAGWRGLAGGVLSSTVNALGVDSKRVIAWLGPAIEQSAFEVGDEVRAQFVARDRDHADAFVANERGRWLADLYRLARRELQRIGVHDVYGGGLGCYADRDRFFSYRRDKQTGRMATLVWLAKEREAGK